MKKLLYFVLAAISVMAVSCSKDDDDKGATDQPKATSITGTWLFYSEDFPETLVLNDDNSYSLSQDLYKEEGNFTYSSNTLTLTASKSYQRDWIRDNVYGGPVFDENGNYQYGEWEVTDIHEPISYPTKTIYEGDVLMLKQKNGDEQDVWAPYVKENATHVSNINDIQGKWYWISIFGDYTMRRVIVNVNGNTGEIIITPWGERYTGTIRYEKGIIYMDNPTFTTTRYDDDNGEYEHMNDADPENSDWRTPFGEYPYEGAYMSGLKFAFVVDGNTAYGGMANLLAPYTKQ